MTIVSNIQSFLRKRLLRANADKQWPFVSGRYRVFDATAPVVIAGTNADPLARDLEALETPGVCLVATACRSTVDVEKLIKNIAANLAVQNVVMVSEATGDSRSGVRPRPND